MPPHRILQNQKIGAVQKRKFVGHRLRQRTRFGRMALLGLRREDMAGVRSSSEPYALLLARTVRENLGATWGLSETGAAGPTGNGYGDAAGHSCLAVAGPVEMAITLETGSPDRSANMEAFAEAALNLLRSALT